MKMLQKIVELSTIASLLILSGCGSHNAKSYSYQDNDAVDFKQLGQYGFATNQWYDPLQDKLGIHQQQEEIQKLLKDSNKLDIKPFELTNELVKPLHLVDFDIKPALDLKPIDLTPPKFDALKHADSLINPIIKPSLKYSAFDKQFEKNHARLNQFKPNYSSLIKPVQKLNIPSFKPTPTFFNAPKLTNPTVNIPTIGKPTHRFSRPTPAFIQAIKLNNFARPEFKPLVPPVKLSYPKINTTRFSMPNRPPVPQFNFK